MNYTANYVIHTPGIMELLLFNIFFPFLYYFGNGILFYFMMKYRNNYEKLRTLALIFLGLLLFTYPMRIATTSINLSEMVLATEIESDYLATVVSTIAYGNILWAGILIYGYFPVMLLPFMILYLSIVFFRRKRRELKRAWYR